MGVYSLSKSGINNWSKFSNVAAGNPQVSDFELIATQLVTSSVASISFTNLQNYSQYKHLQIRMVARSERASSNADDMYMRFNSDTGNNYSYHNTYGYVNSIYSTAGTSTNLMYLGTTPASTSGTSQFGPFVADVLDFSSTTKNKTIRSLGGVPAVPIINFYSGAWYSTSAVTSLTIATQSGNISIGSRFSLYGVK